MIEVGIVYARCNVVCVRIDAGMVTLAAADTLLPARAFDSCGGATVTSPIVQMRNAGFGCTMSEYMPA